MNENSYHSLGRSPHQIIRDGSFATKKEFIHNQLFHHHIVEHNIVIQGLLKKLHASLIHERVPDFYGYFFMGQLTLCSEDRIADSINREIQLLKGKKSHYHLIMRHVDTRETCLRAIGQCLDSLFEQAKPAGLIKLGEEVSHLRQLTVWVIQQIKEWKNSLLFLSANVFEDEHISFFYQGEDYLLKILKDTDFLAKSFLAEKVAFSHKQDPFLMRPCISEAPNNQFTSIFKFDPQKQQQYISCLQFLADERADYLKRKIMAKSDKIREIERVYQARQLNQKILITKTNSIALRKAKISINQAPIDFIDEPKEQDIKRPIRSNSITTLRDSKVRDLQMKGEKIKRIKQMEIGSASPLINVKKFSSSQSNPNALPISRSISLGIFKKMSSKIEKSDHQRQSQTDFESMVRKKELQVLENDNAKRRTISSIRLKDRLSQRKLVDNKEGAQQLRKILEQIQHSSPQKQQALFARRDTPSRTGRTLLQQNQEIMINLRQSILKEIADDTAVRQKAEQQKRQENLILQKLVKTKLDQDTLSHIQKQKAKWTLGKDVLAHDMDKRQLFDLQQPIPNKSQKLSELQQDLKREMQLKFLREVHQELSHREALFKHDKEKKKQQKQRQKELQVVLRKQEQEKRFQQIEQEERSKAMQALLQDQQRNKREIEKQMQLVIEKQQQRLIAFSNEQKMKLQADLREDMKQKLLISLKKEKSVIAAQKEAQQRQRLIEEAHRAEVRKKMEEEFQVEKHLERQRERQEKTRKLRLIAQKMDHLSQEQQQAMLVREKSLNQEKMEELKQNISKFPVAGKVHEESKRKLREQFELQLFAFNRPENLNIQQNSLLIKDFKAQIDNEQNLNKKFNEAEQVLSKKEQTVIMAKESSLKASKLQQSEISDNFVRFSQVDVSEKKEVQFTEQELRAMGIDMTPAEYKIYLKKKQVMSQKRISPEKTVDIGKMRNLLENFEKMSNLDSQKEQTLFIEKSVSDRPPSIKLEPVTFKEPSKQPEHKMKKTPKKQQAVQDSEDLSEVLKLTVHSKMGSMHKKKFVTSDEDDEGETIRRRKKESPRRSSVKKVKIQQSSQEQDKFEQPAPQKIESAYFKTVEWENMDNYLTSHFKNMAKIFRKLNLLKKDQLLKSLQGYKSLMIIQVGSPQQPQGVVLVVQNENKPSMRSLNIIHFGSYKAQDVLSVIVKTRDLLFNNDPCSEITFSMYYNKQDEEQEIFIRHFEKQFDPYGAIFQKKISNDQTERKHIMRRMIGQASKPLVKNKAVGQLKVHQSLISHSNQQSLGVDLGLKKTGKDIGGWTVLSLFLSNFGKEEQIVKELTSDVLQQSKNIKHLSKMAMKLQNNRFADIEYECFESAFETNLKFIQLGAQLVKCDPKIQENHIPITVMRSNMTLTPVLPFVSSTANFHYQDIEKTGKYLRFKCGKGSRVLKLRSSIYSSTVTVVPCKPNNYKILLMDANEFDEISGKTSLDLYIKLFLANISQHAHTTDQFIWIPQFASEGSYQAEYDTHFDLNTQLRNKVELAFTQYVPNCTGYKPTHRDLLITPPFIIAVLNSDIEKCAEGSPAYLQRIDIADLSGVVDVPIPPPQSDF